MPYSGAPYTQSPTRLWWCGLKMTLPSSWTRIRCTIHTVSNKTVVVWTKDDTPLKLDKNQVKFQEVRSWAGNGQHHSDLLIKSLSQLDLSDYGCFASNEVGTDYKVIQP